MRRLFEYRCPTGHEFDELVEYQDNPPPVNCPECSAPSIRQISAPMIDPRLGVQSDSFSTMGDKWARVRRQRRQIEDKKVRDHGPNA